MAGSRIPGSIGTSDLPHGVDDGTMIRALSPKPGPIGLYAPTAAISGNSASMTLMSPMPVRRGETPTIPVLRQGSRGAVVEKLQRLLNLRSQPSPNLKLDGIFGPVTLQALQQYQRCQSISIDGVVGKRTWFHLIKGDKATIPQLAGCPPQISSSGLALAGKLQTLSPIANLRPASPKAIAVSVWPLPDKFAEVLRRTAPKLPNNMRREFEALLSPTNLAIMVGTLVVWAGAHAFGVGEVVDIILLAGGAFYLGAAVFDVAGELGDFLFVTSNANDETELDDAAAHLARAVAIMGVAAFAALLAKIAKGRSGGNGVGTKRPREPFQEQQTLRQNVVRPSPNPDESPSTRNPISKKSITNLTKQDLSDWYKNQGEYFNNPKNLENHLEGTDFTKPVTKKVLPEETELIQYVRQDGKPGMYFARPGTPMEQLGIKEPPPRVVQQFVVKKPIEVVESTAASLDVDLAPGVGGAGGGQQLIFPKGWERYVEPFSGGQ